MARMSNYAASVSHEVAGAIARRVSMRQASPENWKRRGSRCSDREPNSEARIHHESNWFPRKCAAHRHVGDSHMLKAAT
jgi:hypothetical protein